MYMEIPDAVNFLLRLAGIGLFYIAVSPSGQVVRFFAATVLAFIYMLAFAWLAFSIPPLVAFVLGLIAFIICFVRTKD